MARLCMFEKMKRVQKFKVKHRNRCKICGRPRGYLKKFEICRICFRSLALKGELAGVTKASW